MSNLREEALQMHKEKQGKLEVHAKVEVKNQKDLSLAYSPGVAEPCMEIFENDEKIYDYTMKGNLVAVISDGTAVLGLGDIGPKAALPVMEGKALLFKAFADVDAFPLSLNVSSPEQMIEVIKSLEPTFGGINLEDIAAPQCFEIEERLRAECNIPIFHDDQHGTAIVTAAGLINALKISKKEIKDIQIVINGAGAAGTAITKLLLNMGVNDIIMCDTKGIIYQNRPIGMNQFKEGIAAITNKKQRKGTLHDAVKCADVFIGVSAAGALTREMVQSMNENPIIFAMANPIPEIMPKLAKEAGAMVIGTGRSDFPNQVNNVLAFPGIFRGALDVQASEINEEMKIAAVYAIANIIKGDELHPDYIIPNPFDHRVAFEVAYAVAKAAVQTGVAKKEVNQEAMRNRLGKLMNENLVNVSFH